MTTIERDMHAASRGRGGGGRVGGRRATLRRVFSTLASHVRPIGAPFSRRHWRLVGTTVHLMNGAAAGVAFRRLGLRGWKAGVAAAQIESALVWPGMAVVDRYHPDRRTGAWPPLLRNPRVFGQEVAAHAIFGAILGALVRA